MKDLTYDELCEAVDALGQQAGELEAEHRSECAAFGDSWPGACDQIHRANRAWQAAKRELEERPEHKAWLAKLAAEAEARRATRNTNDDDIPF